MKKKILKIGILLTGIAIQSRAAEIGNGLVMVKFENDQLSVSSQVDKSLAVQSLKLPGDVIKENTLDVTDSIWGSGRQLELIHQNGSRRTTLTVYKDQPFTHFQTTIINQGGESINLAKTDVAELELRVGNSLNGLVTLGSGGMKPIKQAEGSFTYTVLADPVTTKGIILGWLTQFRGVGTFTPVVATDPNSYKVNAGLQFGACRVKPGSERGTDTMVIGFSSDVRAGLESFGDALAKAYQIKLPPKPEVYCTWYHRDTSGSGASTEKLIAENAQFARKHLAPFGLNVMQIDDHWQDSMIPGVDGSNIDSFRFKKVGKGPFKTFEKANSFFPGGMQKTAANIEEKGFTPGLWFMPFSGDTYHEGFDKAIYAKNAATGAPWDSKTWSGATIDASSPAGESLLRDRFKKFFDWGYRYYKIDGLHIGAPSSNTYVNRHFSGVNCFADAKIHNPDMTFVEGFRRGLQILREEAPSVFVLGCSTTQNMFSMGGAFGLVHAMRVGPDNDGATKGEWDGVTYGADFAGNLYFLNNRVCNNDPDPYFVRASNPLSKARWMVSWQAVSGAMGTTSIQYADLPQDRLDLIKRALPTHSLNARPVDLLDSPLPRVWTVGNDRLNIVGLFNSSEKEKTQVKCTLTKLGLDASQEFDAYEFWSNQYLGRIKGSLERTLDPASCEVLALRPVSTNPQVISTSRHITQGLMDVVSEWWNSTEQTLSG